MLTPVWKGSGVGKGVASNLTSHSQHEAEEMQAFNWSWVVLYRDELEAALSGSGPEVLNPVRTTECCNETQKAPRTGTESVFNEHDKNVSKCETTRKYYRT